jgi:CheY-like chemotaxis protein/anti-sigma regulatory factor (Ser/Thr protein kinase)
VRSDDELGDLAARFNAMAERLQASYETLEARVRERTAQLAQANEDKTRFFAAANHDLRQPLNALGLFIARLRSDGDPVRRAQHMDRVEAALRNMNALFDALLDISKLDAGAVATRPEVFAMAPLLERLETTFSPLAERKGLRLTVEPSAAWVNSDSVLVERILQNLISNAIRYTDAGFVRVDCAADGERLRVSVRDTGIGMTPEQQARAFDEFYRGGTGAHGRDAEWSAGLGLGLSIVDRLARLLGIDVDLQSTPGVGTTLGVALTLAAAPVAHDRAPDAGSIGARLAFGAGRRALVVDDDALALDAMLALMEEWGFETTAAESFAEAERIARGQTFDLVVSDYHLGDGDGLAVIAAQRAHKPRARAILASGDDDPAISEKARVAAAPLFAKPISPLSLRACVASLLPPASI